MQKAVRKDTPFRVYWVEAETICREHAEGGDFCEKDGDHNKVHFAKLLSDFGGNQIVLEITNRGSTYAATNIFVISAYVEERSTGGTDGEIKKIPEILFLLNTMDYGYPTGGTEWHEGICSDSLSMGLEIVNIEGLEQQGLQICYLAPQEIAGQKNFKTRTIYWDCGVWRVCQ